MLQSLLASHLPSLIRQPVILAVVVLWSFDFPSGSPQPLISGKRHHWRQILKCGLMKTESTLLAFITDHIKLLVFREQWRALTRLIDFMVQPLGRI